MSEEIAAERGLVATHAYAVIGIVALSALLGLVITGY
jgi:hypothetical protein